MPTVSLFLLFRYLMVCHSRAIAGEEKNIGNKARDFLIMISLGFGVAPIFYSDSIRVFHLCMGKEERFLLDIPGHSAKSGVQFRLDFFNPFRLCINIAGALFIFVVPMLYYQIFKFRKKQDNSIQGNSVKSKHYFKDIFKEFPKLIAITENRKTLCLQI